MSQETPVPVPMVDVAEQHLKDAEPGRPEHGARLVEVQGVTKTFGAGTEAVTALDDVSLAIAHSEFFTLLGPSGCGKTTLLRLLAGFEHPESGAVLLDGRDVLGDPPHRRPVNTVFQSYALFPHMTVAQNVAFGLERLGLDRTTVKARVEAMLRLVRMETMPSRHPRELSGGQQQRVALARALAPRPKLLLLDEPLSALDLKLRRSMQIELKRLQRETGVTFLLVTHDQDEAFSVSDRIAVMDRGRILQVGTPQSIYARPTCRFVADFTGANVLPGALLGLQAPYAAIRPERVSLVAQGGLPGRLVDVTYRGARTACLVALEAGPHVMADCFDPPAGLACGQPVRCSFDPAATIPLGS